MQIIPSSSPNFDSRENHAIDMLVLHYTGMKTGAEALARMCDPASKVSAHYMVEEDGRVFRLVEEHGRAWHAGVSYWRGNTNINQRSIGIEMVNPGHEFGYRPFPQAQMRSVRDLCKGILARHEIPARNVVAHSDIAPVRKEDPGELFDWKWLAEEGVGAWPFQVTDGKLRTPENTVDSACHPSSVNRLLSAYGYDTADVPKAIFAFQRHFRADKLNGQWDAECAALLRLLL